MAKALGESGRYVSQEALKKSRRIMLIVLLVTAAIAIIEGMLLESYVPIRLFPSWLRILIIFAALPAVWLLQHFGIKKLDALDKKRADLRRGATGENLVGQILTNFPDDFYVINDLTTPYGNLDHVVVGPTGVFALDTKSWRGVVSADGHGELLLNGKPTDKPFCQQFVGRMLGIKDRALALAPGLDPYYQALFVFTAARVEAKWGTTGHVHCVCDDQLYEYIVEKKSGQRLNPRQVEMIAQAFRGLAQMDRAFEGNPAAMAASHSGSRPSGESPTHLGSH